MAHSLLVPLLRAQPFRPIEFHLSDGRSIRVEHPENCLLTKTSLVIDAGDDHLSTISLLHIVSAKHADPNVVGG